VETSGSGFPKGLLTQAERSILTENKAAIVRLLGSEPVVETPVVEPDLDQQDEPVEFTTAEGLTIRFAEPDLDEEDRRPSGSLRQCGSSFLWWGLRRSSPLHDVASGRLPSSAHAETGQNNTD